jgi:DNA-binding transcriptional MerR regulator
MAELSVAALAKRVGVSPDTIRYYDRLGLLPAPRRTAAGYRRYGEDVADRVRFIKGAQRLGLRLREVAELLAIRDRGQCPCGHTQTIVARRIAELDTELARLAALRGELARLADRCPPQAYPDGRWPCEAEFIHAAELDTGKEVATRA